MPTLQTLGVHPDVCRRLVTRPNFVSRKNDRNGSNDDDANARALIKYHKPNPKDVLICPIDSMYMMNESMKQATPITIAQARRLKREIARAHRDYYNQHEHRKELIVETENNKKHQPEKIDIQSIYSVRERIQLRGLHPRNIHLPICRGLDELLSTNAVPNEQGNSDTLVPGGGISCGHVTEISGPPCSGKTTLACSLCATNHEALDAAWIVSSSGCVMPHARRLAQLSAHLPRSEQIMNKTMISSFSNEFDLLAILVDIESTIRERLTSLATSPCSRAASFLIIVDSLDPMNFERSMSDRIAQRLRFFSRAYSAAVVLINAISNNHRNNNWQRDPVMGDLRLHLSRPPELQPQSDAATTDRAAYHKQSCTILRATLERHPKDVALGVASDKPSCLLKISEQGVFPA